jgi:DHA1 family tetracycline resistance protein-like MFS transporter
MTDSHAPGSDAPPEGQPSQSTHALVFVFITVLVDTIGFGIVLPVMPALLMELTGETVSQASLDGGYLAFSYAIMQFFFGPVIGNLSDHFGRRPVLLFALLAFGLDYLVMGLAPSFAWLFLGRMVAGISGSSYTTAYACVADISPPESRAQNFGIVGAAFGVGFILGPALGGLMGGLGPRAPFFAAAGLALVNVIYGYLLFPETLAPESRRAFTWKRANTLGTLASIRRYPAVVGIAAALFLWQFAHQVLPNTFAYYVKLKFDWDELAIGVSLAYAGITMAIVQGALTRVLVPRLGEHAAGLLGIAAGVAGYLGYAFSSAGWMMYACMTFAAFMGLAFPSMNSIMSRQIPASAQGELQGAVASSYSLTSIMSPLAMTQLFGYFTGSSAPIYFPGAAFAFAALLTLASAMLFVRATRRLAPEPAEARDLAEAPQPLVE